MAAQEIESEPSSLELANYKENHISNGRDLSQLEWKVKYERLFEAHRKLQKTNNALEDKLLRIVDKFEAEKNQMRRDLASQTQRLVESKLTIQRLHDQNRNLQSDLNLSINLLRNRPNAFVPQKMDALPVDVRASVRSYAAEKSRERSEGKKIRVAIPDDISGSSFSLNTDQDELVSAAILAKVLEERDKERRRDRKFCIDVGTQTHGWQFPAGKAPLATSGHIASSSSNGSGTSKCSSDCSSPSSPGDSNDSPNQGVLANQDNSDVAQILPSRPSSVRSDRVLGILCTSVIHTGERPAVSVDIESKLAQSQSFQVCQPEPVKNTPDLPLKQQPCFPRSYTCSALQTDI